jgi:hypothetical protein
MERHGIKGEICSGRTCSGNGDCREERASENERVIFKYKDVSHDMHTMHDTFHISIDMHICYE